MKALDQKLLEPSDMVEASVEMCRRIVDGTIDAGDDESRDFFESLADTGFNPAKMMMVIIDYRTGKIGFKKALCDVLSGIYTGEVTDMEKRLLQSFFSYAIKVGELVPVRGDGEQYKGMSLAELIQEVLDEKDSLHVRADLLSALYRELSK